MGSNVVYNIFKYIFEIKLSDLVSKWQCSFLGELYKLNTFYNGVLLFSEE